MQCWATRNAVWSRAWMATLPSLYRSKIFSELSKRFSKAHARHSRRLARHARSRENSRYPSWKATSYDNHLERDGVAAGGRRISQTPWSERQLEIRLKNKKAATEARTKVNEGRIPNTEPSQAPADYAGAWRANLGRFARPAGDSADPC